VIAKYQQQFGHQGLKLVTAMVKNDTSAPLNEQTVLYTPSLWAYRRPATLATVEQALHQATGTQVKLHRAFVFCLTGVS